MLTRFCIDCHNADYNEAGVVLDRLDPDVVRGDDADHWHSALDMINSGEMPPEDGEQPTSAERQALADWITDSLAAARAAGRGDAQPRLRRLTKRQYANTLQELLRLPIEFGKGIPDDSPSEMGFRNHAATQQTTSLHLEYYEAVAREALGKAIVVGKRPTPVRYRVRIGRGVAPDSQAMEVRGYQAKPLSRKDVSVEILDADGQQKTESGGGETASIERNIGIDMRGSDSGRYGVTDDGLVLYSALPHVEVAPKCWQGPSPNLKVLLRRCFPQSGPFAVRVWAAPTTKNSMASHEMLAISSEEPMIKLDAAGLPEMVEGAIWLRANDFDLAKNLELRGETLHAEDVTQRSHAKATFFVDAEGLYQFDLVYPIGMEAAMASIGLHINDSSEHVVLAAPESGPESGLAVSPVAIARLSPGENTLQIRNKFFGGLRHLVATPLANSHPTLRRLAAEAETDETDRPEAPPALRAFLGTRADDGMAYETFGDSTPLRGVPGETEVYEFCDYLENLPTPPPSPNDKGPLAGIMIVGVWNDHLVSKRSDAGSPLLIESIEFEAPYYPEWPPASHASIFFDDPASVTDRRGYTRRVIAAFVSRAFRRPATSEEVDRYVGYWLAVRDDFPNYEQGVLEALVPVLCSPSFLYVAPTADQEFATEYALASKLAYLLWDSSPDEWLLGLARDGNLRASLPGVVDKMLSSPKSRRFVETFAGEWLRLDRHEAMSVNAKEFPRYNRFVKSDMREETFQYLHHAFVNNLSARVLVDSEFAMLNQNLAEYYGIEGVNGTGFRPVPVDVAAGRGGLLTHGAFLTGHSDGTHSHPIKRAVWLKERIIGDPAPPPPPNVPELDPETPGFDKMTLKEQLEVHRDKDSCRACHRKIDPYGVLFEEFDAVGRRREKVGGAPIDAHSELPDGARLTGVDELKNYLLTERYEDVLRSLCERLFAYATGQDVTFAEQPEIDRLLDGAKRDDGLASLLVAVVETESFLGVKESTSRRKADR